MTQKPVPAHPLPGSFSTQRLSHHCSRKLRLRRTSFVLCSAGHPEQPRNGLLTLSFPASDLAYSLPLPAISLGHLSLWARRQHFLFCCSSRTEFVENSVLPGLASGSYSSITATSLSPLGSVPTLKGAGTGSGNRGGREVIADGHS